MRLPAILLFSGLTLMLQTANNTCYADPVDAVSQETGYTEEQKIVPQEPAAPFKAFTGKITKNKVRLRQQPSLDSSIIRELNKDDMLVVVGESDDFYAVQPPTNAKAYVFRAYVIDNVIEANKVNIRLEPDVEAPIVAQLSSGDRVEGTISSTNNKWLEIAMPASARFYIAKDYVERIGDPSFMTAMERRREEVNLLLSSTYLASQSEMQKSFPEINLEDVSNDYNKVISNYPDFPEQVARAKDSLTSLQDSYLQKKLAYLEGKAKIAQSDWQTKNAELNEQVKVQQQRLQQLEQQLNKPVSDTTVAQNRSGLSTKMASWQPIEQAVYEAWVALNPNGSLEDFYHEQRQHPITLQGIIEPYTRPIKNKPGDYVVVNQANNLPIAYLYSTQVNLQDHVGHNVTIYASPRANNNFAFPAYYVLSIE